MCDHSDTAREYSHRGKATDAEYFLTEDLRACAKNAILRGFRANGGAFDRVSFLPNCAPGMRIKHRWWADHGVSYRNADFVGRDAVRENDVFVAKLGRSDSKMKDQPANTSASRVRRAAKVAVKSAPPLEDLAGDTGEF